MKAFCKAVSVLIIGALSLSASAQSVPAGEEMENYYRLSQLLGKLDSSISFSVRPIFPNIGMHYRRNAEHHNRGDSSIWRPRTLYDSPNQLINIRLLPISWRSQFNSNTPYGWNDGSMIPSRGFQTQLRAGVYARVGPLSIQLQPEYVYAENRGFEVFDLYGGVPDIQPRFGSGTYSQVSLGQSSVRLTAGPVSVGVSNENVWWGPGLRNALILSNNSRGFKHITLNSIRPISSPAGSFEIQILGGRLESSEYTPLNRDPQFDDWRYLAGLNISYQPKWLPGIFFGLTRSFQVYGGTLEGFKDYFPFFTPYEKVKDLNQNIFGQDAKDQLTSVYGRWLFPKANAEVYFEYGINDNAYNFRDFIGSPEHSRTYTAGFRKLVHLNRIGQFIEVAGELTQMEQTIDRIVRPAGDWYYHSQILQGHTHRGEVLGAGIGPGSNLQSLDLTWHQGYNSLGIQLDRMSHSRSETELSNDQRWVDFSLAGHGSVRVGKVFLNGGLRLIRSLNYQWQQENLVPGTYYIPENDLWNFHGAVGVTYSF